MTLNTQENKAINIFFDGKSLEILDQAADNLSISRAAMVRFLINRYGKEFFSKEVE